MRILFNFFVFLFFLLSFSMMAHSAVILKIKGRKALVDLEGVSVKAGDKFDALNLYGKPLGLLEIRKVKKGKAIAVLLKGKMGNNWILEPSARGSKRAFVDEEDKYIPVNKKKSAKSSSKSASFSSSSLSKKFDTSRGVGFIVGPHYNTITVAADKSVSGLSLAQANLIVDLSLIGPLGIRLILGYQSLQVDGNNCGLSNCRLLIGYPGAGFLFRAVFLKHLILQPWLGAGGFLFWPLVDVEWNLGLDKKSFESFHGALTVVGGMDIHFFPGLYMPIQIDFGWINPVILSSGSLKKDSKEFKPFYMGIKTGIGFAF